MVYVIVYKSRFILLKDFCFNIHFMSPSHSVLPLFQKTFPTRVYNFLLWERKPFLVLQLLVGNPQCSGSWLYDQVIQSIGNKYFESDKRTQKN